MAGNKKVNNKDKDFESVPAPDRFLPNLEETKQVLTLSNERTRKVVGFFLLVVSLAMLISFFSFFTTWKNDQDYLINQSYNEFKEVNGKMDNALGVLGAKIGFLFVHNGFGVAAFLLLPALFLLGLWLFFEYKPLSIIRIAIHSLLLTIGLSVLISFVFGSTYPVLGGAFGYGIANTCKDLVGNIGLALIIILYGFGYSILFLNFFPLQRLGKRFTNKVDNMVNGAVTNNPLATSENSEYAQPEVNEIDLDDLIGKENVTNLKTPNPLPPIGFEVITKEMEFDAPTLQKNNKKVEEKVEENRIENIPFEVPNIPFEIPNISEFQNLTEEFVIEDNTKVEEQIVDPEDFEKNETNPFGVDTMYDPTLDLSTYQFPTIDLLKDYDQVKHEIDVKEIERSKDLIIETLSNYKIAISKIKASVGPTVTLYEIVPAPGIKISKIKNLEDDIALSLAALGIRIIAPIPGKGTIGIEVPNKNPEMVPMKSVLASAKFQTCNFELPVILGKTISNEIFMADLTKMPHLLMAGATGQGKSVGLNAILVSLLYKKHPAFVKFVLIDPKKVELTLFNKIERHFLAKLPGEGDAIITENEKVIHTLNSLCVEMDNRYKLLQDAMVRTIVEYNKKFIERKLNPQNGHVFLPYIVVVIDEVADLMMTAGKEIETPIARLAQLARAIGIHLILATQRPSVNVITGMIKANFPSRIAFRVTSKIDSRTILDANGADQLIGKGDMLYSGGNDMIRLQCPFVDTPEVEAICDFIGEQRAYSLAFQLPEIKTENGPALEMFDPNERDELFNDAALLIVINQSGSTSLIQRKLKLGYNRAGRIMDQLEDSGIVGPSQGSKPRAVFIPDEYALERFLQALN